MRESHDASLPKWYDQLGSFHKNIVLSHTHAIPDIANRIVREEVPCFTFRSLVARHGIKKLDLVLIDTEGYDLEILKQFDFAAFRPRLFIYERKHLGKDGQRAAMRLLNSHGYAVHPCGHNAAATPSVFHKTIGRLL